MHPCPSHTPQVPDISVKDSQKNLKKSLEKGILKILSKMGISLLGCYHGAQIFEAYGLGREVVDVAFTGSVSRIGGMSFADLQREAESFWAKVREGAVWSFWGGECLVLLLMLLAVVVGRVVAVRRAG
jgi:hypothetical protein